MGQDVETDLGLTREKLIHMALLLGSDYTEASGGALSRLKYRVTFIEDIVYEVQGTNFCNCVHYCVIPLVSGHLLNARNIQDFCSPF